MLWETLERVNLLRQQAMSDVAFIQSASDHEQALEEQRVNRPILKTKKPQTFAQRYKPIEFYSPTEWRSDAS